jgi:hypothetical protein
MTKQFAKLFDTPHGQMLYYLDDTDDEEPAIMVIGAYVRGVRPSAKLSGWPDEEAGQLRAFAEIEQAAADETAAAFYRMADDLAPRDSGSRAERHDREDGHGPQDGRAAEGIAQTKVGP